MSEGTLFLCQVVSLDHRLGQWVTCLLFLLGRVKLHPTHTNSLWATMSFFFLMVSSWGCIPWPTVCEWQCPIVSTQQSQHNLTTNSKWVTVPCFSARHTIITSHPITNSQWVDYDSTLPSSRQSHHISYNSLQVTIAFFCHIVSSSYHIPWQLNRMWAKLPSFSPDSLIYLDKQPVSNTPLWVLPFLRLMIIMTRL